MIWVWRMISMRRKTRFERVGEAASIVWVIQGVNARFRMLGAEMIRFWQLSSSDDDSKAPIPAMPNHSYRL